MSELPRTHDPVKALERVFASRCGPRLREALVWYLEGVSCREAASRVGLRHHRSIVRQSHRLGLSSIHERRRRARGLRRRLEHGLEEPLMRALQKGTRLPPRSLVRAFRQSSDLLLDSYELDGLED